MKRAAWVGFLGQVCPGEVDTLLLRACLLRGEICARAYSEWIDVVGPPQEYFRRDRLGHKRLLPLLARALREARVDIPRDFAIVLRAAYLYEDLRARTFRAQAAPILKALLHAELDFALLPGVVLAESLYEDWALRHCHDLDLLIDPAGRTAAAGVLSAEGLTILKAPFEGEGGSSIFESSSGLQVCLHTRVSPVRLFEPPREVISLRRQTIAWDGVEIATLSRTDLLLYVCLAACTARRRSLRWACDAFLLIENPSSIDWDHLWEMSERTCSALPLSVLLGFLADELGAPIRGIQQIRDGSEPTAQLQETLCDMVVFGQGLSVRQLLRRTPSARVRFAVVRHLMAPSRSFLLRERGVRGVVAILREYASRLLMAVKKVMASSLSSDARQGDK